MSKFIFIWKFLPSASLPPHRLCFWIIWFLLTFKINVTNSICSVITLKLCEAQIINPTWHDMSFWTVNLTWPGAPGALYIAYSDTQNKVFYTKVVQNHTYSQNKPQECSSGSHILYRSIYRDGGHYQISGLLLNNHREVLVKHQSLYVHSRIK